MDDAISRQAVLDYIDKMPSELTADGRRMIRRRTLEEYISDTLPPVNPQELKTGHWYYDEEREATGIYAICSNCDEEIYQTGNFKYCPNCGAKMSEIQTSSESNRTCHTCKHYTSGEYDGSCGSYICGHYSNWESEDEE